MGRRAILGLAASIGGIAALMSPSSSAADFSPYGGPLGQGLTIFPGALEDSKDDAVPVESVSLRFGSMQVSYKEDHPKEGGAVVNTWEVSENAGKK